MTSAKKTLGLSQVLDIATSALEAAQQARRAILAMQRKILATAKKAVTTGNEVLLQHIRMLHPDVLTSEVLNDLLSLAVKTYLCEPALNLQVIQLLVSWSAFVGDDDISALMQGQDEAGQQKMIQLCDATPWFFRGQDVALSPALLQVRPQLFVNYCLQKLDDHGRNTLAREALDERNQTILSLSGWQGYKLPFNYRSGEAKKLLGSSYALCWALDHGIDSAQLASCAVFCGNVEDLRVMRQHGVNLGALMVDRAGLGGIGEGRLLITKASGMLEEAKTKSERARLQHIVDFLKE